jgi:hypothetical protein
MYLTESTIIIPPIKCSSTDTTIKVTIYLLLELNTTTEL